MATLALPTHGFQARRPAASRASEEHASKTRSQAALSSPAEWNHSLFEAQQRARRGPTPEVFFAKHFDNSRLVTADDPQRTREMRMFTCAIAAVFVLIMVYGLQHLSAIEYGYRIEAEKQQREVLREQNHQLKLTEAQLCDLGRIDRIAHQYGLNAPQPGQVVRPELTPAANAPIVAQASPALPALR